MSLTESGAAVEEERVVAGAWGVNNTGGGSNGEVVIATNDEVIHSVFAIETIAGAENGILDRFDAIFDFKFITSAGNLAGASLGLAGGNDFEIDRVHFDIVFLERFFNNCEKFGAELLDTEDVFGTDDDVAAARRDERSVLEPSGEVG